jgi:hypothetical protein
LTLELPYERAWIENGLILRYRFYDSSRATADAWFQDTVTLFRTWERHRPLLTLLDIRLQGAFITAQALMRARQATHLSPDVPGRTAVLIASPIAAQVISTLIRSGLAHGSTRQRLVFSDETNAIQWLLLAVKH